VRTALHCEVGGSVQFACGTKKEENAPSQKLLEGNLERLLRYNVDGLLSAIE